jgi:hypothetical protein
MADAGLCIPPPVVIGPTEIGATLVNPSELVDVEWCNSGRSCATCTWEFFYPEVEIPTSAPCIFPDLDCPGPSIGAADARLTSCAAQPAATYFDGVQVQLPYDQASPDAGPSGAPPLGCLGRIDGGGPGDGGQATFNAAACLLGGFTCVPACSDCP